MSNAPLPPRDENDPAERELSRRSHNPSLGIWTIVGGLILLGLVIYAVSAVL